MSSQTPPQCADGMGLGVAGIYAGGIRWAVKRNDTDPAGPGSPSYYEFTDEAKARDFYESNLEAAKRFLPEYPERWPELVAARITWAVQQ